MHPRLLVLIAVTLAVMPRGPSWCADKDAWSWQDSAPSALSTAKPARLRTVTIDTGRWTDPAPAAGPPASVPSAPTPHWETPEAPATEPEIRLVNGVDDWTDDLVSDIPPPPQWHDSGLSAGDTHDGSESAFRATMREIWQDHCAFYSRDSLLLMALGTAVASPIANTSADREIRNWYQDNVRSSSTDSYAEAIKDFGYQWDVIPLYAAAAVSGRLIDSRYPEFGGSVAVWGDRNMRALVVGTPPLLFMQKLLGAGRPEEGSSHWSLWDDMNAVSGHAFVGALPLLTAAEMTDSPFLRRTLYLASPAVGITRINDDAHYFSQVALGWGLAWVATRAVSRKDIGLGCVQFLPFGPTGGPGLSFLAAY